MKVAIVQPGAPLPDAPPFDPAAFDAVIAIEGAAANHPASWWLVQRPETFEQTAAQGEPRLFTTADCLRALSVGPRADELDADPETGNVRTFEPLWQQYPSSLGWSLYPAAAAAVLAASLGATAIEVFGTADAAGRSEACRTCERQVIQGVADHLAKAGIVLTEHSPAPAAAPAPTSPPATAPKHKRRKPR